ncbi:7-carboxy-7-deazaguanine synthase [Anaerobacterium chartisolvens]|uniref:7-carboxy-7-deazaguanine synthase n=1 Tax=Anaerobacterium chartisolvens TaxID=1297424 RepID=A0A369BI20_9FIRM|nr:radical SAM protein [Anaerobacterium chartisolvens]RCX20206.1 7-carboxy-7-deazaguanine synthase [Anaerobacterium chartisolvens]
MKVNEIFLSIQGEGLSSGFPTVFVRFAGCNLRCRYCDTVYAYYEGEEMTCPEIFNIIQKYGYKRVCLTGGEPLLQDGLDELLGLLKGYAVTIETNGSVRINKITMIEGHSFVMDMKAPSSGHDNDMLMENFDCLRENDEIKFVIGSRQDYEWAKSIIDSYHSKGSITFSPVYGTVSYQIIVDWILKDRLDVRFQLQLHKLIWDPSVRGV